MSVGGRAYGYNSEPVVDELWERVKARQREQSARVGRAGEGGADGRRGEAHGPAPAVHLFGPLQVRAVQVQLRRVGAIAELRVRHARLRRIERLPEH